MPRYLTKKTVTQVFYYITVAPDSKEAVEYTKTGANIIDRSNSPQISNIWVISEIPTETKTIEDAFMDMPLH